MACLASVEPRYTVWVERSRQLQKERLPGKCSSIASPLLLEATASVSSSKRPQVSAWEFLGRRGTSGFVWRPLTKLLFKNEARITSLQEEIKGVKNNLEKVEEERKLAQDMLNNSEKVR